MAQGAGETPNPVPAAPAVEPSTQPAPVANSALDDRLLYQLLVGEMALNSGDAGSAYELLLDAARRTRDEGLFRRAVDIALQSRAGDQALNATRAWREAVPDSQDALRMQMQILLVMNKADMLAEPLGMLLAVSPAPERPGIIMALPRFLQRVNNPSRVAALMEEVLKPYREEPGTRIASRVSLGRAWQDARDPERALALAREAQALDATAPGPALLAMELMKDRPEAEGLVAAYLAQAKAEPAMRLAYVRTLTDAQRYADAVAQLETATKLQPNVAAPFLSLGALQLELKRPKEGEAALMRYVELAQATPDASVTGASPGMASPSSSPSSLPSPTAPDPDDDDEPGTDAGAAGGSPRLSQAQQGLIQAWLLLAQSAEQRSDFPAAERWLAKIDDPQRALDVQSRRAAILVRQGKVAQARELIQRVPERRADDARAKLIAEAGVLRDAKQWRTAFDLLGTANKRFADDADLLYEQAMTAEKIDRLDEMERLLRRVIELKPQNAHAHNALGYSLADRRQRLPEARALVQRALELQPGDPFITDSLGWVEFRLGNRDEAASLLRRAYAARPDPEIAAHLGEVLWAMGQRDEARKVWREAKVRDSANDVLRETLGRLRVDL